MNIEQVRKDFPLLQKSSKGKPFVYFDNACSSLRPVPVIQAINDYYNDYPACGGRSMHKLGEIVTNKVDEARSAVARFIGAKKKEEIVFTRNTTESINIIARCFGLKKGDIVITTDKEHNSNLIPWQLLCERTGAIHNIVRSKEDNTFDVAAFEAIMDERVKLVSMAYTSNLDGVSIPAEEIIKISHKFGAKVLLDAAQTVPHCKIDVSKLDVDFVAFSAHKMLGPSGVGVLYGKYNLLEELAPMFVGGDTVESSTYKTHKLLPPPEKFEAGLQDYAGIIGFGAAVKYLESVGWKSIMDQEQSLNAFITKNIIDIPRLHIIGPADPSLRGGVVSFYIDGIDSHQITLVLDETANIMLRSGQHCVHSWFNARGIESSVRASLYFYNTMEEAEMFVENLKKVIAVYK